MALPQAAVDKFHARCKSSFSYFCENDLAPIYIPAKKSKEAPNGGIVRFKPRRGQRKLINNLDAQVSLSGAARLIDDKARQIGSTTVGYIFVYWYALYHSPGGLALIGCHLKEPASAIVIRLRTLWQKYHRELRPRLVNDRSTRWDIPLEFSWEDADDPHEVRTRIKILTYENPEGFTSEAASCVLLSEFAKASAGQQELLAKSIEPMFTIGHGAIFIDSTAEDVGTRYHALVEGAAQRENEYDFVFISPLDDDNCWLDVSKEEGTTFWRWTRSRAMNDPATEKETREVLGLTATEIDLLFEHVLPYHRKLTPEDAAALHPFGHIKFRRAKVISLGSEALYKNQFPMCWEESFLVSGSTIFNLARTSEQLERINRERHVVGNLLDQRGRSASTMTSDILLSRTGSARAVQYGINTFRFVEEPFGQVCVYERPQHGSEYIVASDYSEGIDSKETDYSVVHVYKRGDGIEQVAWFRGKVAPDETADIAAALGAWYGMAWEVPEVNSVGAGSLPVLMAVYPRSRLFRRPVFDRLGSNEPTDLFGWKMHGRSKWEAISAALAMWKDGHITLHSRATIKEMRLFVKPKGNATPRAMDGHDAEGERYHDDEVDVMCMAAYAHRALPFSTRFAKSQDIERGDVLDDDGTCVHWVTDQTTGRCVKCNCIITQHVPREGVRIDPIELRTHRDARRSGRAWSQKFSQRLRRHLS